MVTIKKKTKRINQDYRHLFSRMTEGFALNEIIRDEKGNPTDYRFLEVNPAFEIYTGLKRKDVIGVHRNKLLPPNPASFKHYCRVVITGKPAHFESYSKHVNKYRQVYAYRTAPNRFATIFTDITDRKKNEATLKKQSEDLKKLNENLKQMQLAVENASDLIIITDPEGRIIYANKAIKSQLGLAPSKVIGKKASILGKQMGRQFYQDLWQTIKIDKNNFSGEITNLKANGKPMVFELNISPVLDANNKVMFFVAIERDCTAAKEMDRAKSEFISLASHQLRTPLTVISLATELLLKEEIVNAPKSMRDHMDQIHRNIAQMTALIDLFLNVSRIELGRLEINPEPLNLIDFSRQILENISLETASRKQTLKINLPINLPVINIDRNLLNIALENLLSNACKYTPKGGTIGFSLAKIGENIAFRISDTGRGIPKNQLPQLFTKMFRASNTSDVKGIGLGLYITKNIIEQSKGKITIKTAENKGSTFSIFLPLTNKKRTKAKK